MSLSRQVALTSYNLNFIVGTGDSNDTGNRPENSIVYDWHHADG